MFNAMHAGHRQVEAQNGTYLDGGWIAMPGRHCSRRKPPLADRQQRGAAKWGMAPDVTSDSRDEIGS